MEDWEYRPAMRGGDPDEKRADRTLDVIEVAKMRFDYDPIMEKQKLIDLENEGKLHFLQDQFLEDEQVGDRLSGLMESKVEKPE